MDVDIDLINGKKADIDGNNYIQLLGNCSCIGYLGNARIRGPVDNCLTKGVQTLRALLTNTYLEKLLNTKPVLFKRKPSFEGDLTTGYDYDFIQIIHNNPLEQKYIEEVSKRIITFNTFYNQLKIKDNYYFVVCFNMYDIDNITHKADINRIIGLINWLNAFRVLDKTIFVQTKTVNIPRTADWWSKDLDFLVKHYNIKLITIEDNLIRGTGIEVAHNQFLEKIHHLLN